jgi:hypothetical protein
MQPKLPPSSGFPILDRTQCKADIGSKRYETAEQTVWNHSTGF